MLKIKLSIRGKTHQRTYRVVVAEARSKLNSAFVDDLGFYTPQTKELKIDEKKMEYWLQHGAQLTTGIDKLLHPDKYPVKKKVKKADKTEAKKEPEAAPATEEAPAK